jgi:hypothetical protein
VEKILAEAAEAAEKAVHLVLAVMAVQELLLLGTQSKGETNEKK